MPPCALVLNGDIHELSRITAEVADFCCQHELPQDVEFDLNLVLEELFTNSLNHGGCGGIRAAVDFQLTLMPDGVRLDYGDRGAPFDPLNTTPPDLTASLEDRLPGGLGIHLVRQIMRDCEYRRTEDWNRLRMRRPVPAEESGG